jgi:hypothetical protein
MGEHIDFLIIAAGIVTACWAQLKRAIGWLRGLVVVEYRCDTPTGWTVVSYLGANAKRITRSSVSTFGGARLMIRPLGRMHRVFWESFATSPRTFWMWKPVWFAPRISRGGGAVLVSDVDPDYDMVFSFVRGTLDWDTLLLAAADHEATTDDADSDSGFSRHTVKHHVGSLGSKGDRDAPDAASNGKVVRSSPSSASFIPRRLLCWTLDDISPEKPDSTLDSMSLRSEQLAAIKRVRFWLESRYWYVEKGIPWRLGAMFQGPPGTGKTSLARGIAEDLGLPIHVFDLASMTNRDLRQAWSSMLSDAPCMALIEDVDGVFHGRRNIVEAQGSLSFDCLLNCWDGVERTDGVFVVVTTNDPSKIDPAILAPLDSDDPDVPSRPGRVDLVVDFHPLDLAGRVKVAERIIDDPDEAQVLAAKYSNDSAARFQERCMRLALARRFGD